MTHKNYKNLEDFHQQRNILNERLHLYGHENLIDSELIHCLTGISVAKIKSAIETHGLQDLVKYVHTYDLTKPQHSKLEMLYEFSKRLALAPYKNRSVLDSSSIAGEFMVKALSFYSNEVLLIAILDTCNRLINTVEISRGTINEAPIYPRELIKTILVNNGCSIVLAHNHPASSLKPSSSDINCCKSVQTALNSVNVKLIDNIIVAEDKYFSFAEQGLL